MRAGHDAVKRRQGVVLRVNRNHPCVDSGHIWRDAAGGGEHELVLDVADAGEIDENAVLAGVEIIDDGLHGVRLKAGPFFPILDDDAVLAGGGRLVAAGYKERSGSQAEQDESGEAHGEGGLKL